MQTQATKQSEIARTSTSPKMKEKQIMKAAGETTGKVYEGPNSPVLVEIALLSLLCTGPYHAYVT